MGKNLITKNRRKNRVRKKIRAAAKYPRLSVYRSNKHIYVQLIDDNKSHTLTSANDQKIKDKQLTKTKRAEKVGEIIAENIKKLKISQVIFDRGYYKYTGRIKQIAEAVKKAGIKI